MAREAVDRYRAVTQREDHVLVPLRDPDQAREVLPAPIVEEAVPANPRRAPIERVREALRGRIPDPLIGELPEGWSRLGEVLLLRLPDALAEHEGTIAAAYAEVLDARSVLALEGTEGPLREPVTRHLHGEADTETVHREDGLVYHLDPSQVLFSPGNHHERHRLAEAVEPGEQIVDLFAGVGYFTLPLARAGARVTACELNPTAAGYLRRNLEANGLADRVELREGDARDRAPSDTADRVLMGYFPGTERFLPTARRALAPDGGRVHYHTLASGDEPLEEAWRELAGHPAWGDVRVERGNARKVKTYKPGTWHVVVDAEVQG